MPGPDPLRPPARVLLAQTDPAKEPGRTGYSTPPVLRQSRTNSPFSRPSLACAAHSRRKTPECHRNRTFVGVFPKPLHLWHSRERSGKHRSHRAQADFSAATQYLLGRRSPLRWALKPAPSPGRLCRRPRCHGTPRLSVRTSTAGRVPSRPRVGQQSGVSSRADRRATFPRS